MAYQVRGFYIPERMMGGIKRYLQYGVQPGDFLTAVICNNFVQAVGKADEENQKNLPAYAMYFYNEAPSECWGSPEKMRSWMEKKEREMEEDYAKGSL